MYLISNTVYPQWHGLSYEYKFIPSLLCYGIMHIAMMSVIIID